MTRLTPTTIIPPMPSNLSDKEALAFVQHYFPNLQGPLKQLVDRFENRFLSSMQQNVLTDVRVVEEQQGNTSCPNCGTLFTLDQ